MRVALLLPSLDPGGAEIRTVALAVGLQNAGCSTLVATLRPGGDPGLLDRLERASIRVCSVSGSAGRKELRAFCGRMGAREPLVLHSAMTSAGLLGLALRRQVAAPWVHSFTNTLRPNRAGRRSFRSRTAWVTDAVLARRADAIQVVSADLDAQLSIRFPRLAGKITVVADVAAEPAFDEADESSRALLSPPVRGAELRVLTLGRLAEHKGHDIVLDALPMVEARRPGVHLVVAGTGPERMNLERRAARLGMTARVTFAGWTRSPRSFLDWADVLVHCSRYEGLSRACIEAVNRGVPVIMANTPSSRELARRFPDRIKVVPSANSMALARAVILQPGRSDTARRGWFGACTEPPSMVHQMQVLYSRLTKGIR
jgi:glycosyltransferase involved in cell wall biosynthesis